MATEIIADSAGGITLQVLINLLELSVASAFKRILLIAKSMHRDAILSLRENNIELAKEIAKSAERVADHATIIAKDIIEMGRPLNNDIIEKTAEMSDFALKVLDEACLSLFKRDYNSADKAIEKAHKIGDLEKAIISTSSKLSDINEMYRIKMITENIRRVAEYASDIAETVLNMTVQQTLRKD